MATEISNIPSTYLNRNVWAGVLFGVGLVTFLDEAIFHQLLHWHHFYDKSTKGFGLVSDGLFHAFSWFATIGGLFIVADLRRRDAFWFKRWWAGVMVGGGVFNFYDGTIQHKLMRIHQIRYHVNIIPYDWAWNIIALMMIIMGTLLIFRTQRQYRHRRRTSK